MAATSIEWTDFSINPIRASRTIVAGDGMEIERVPVGHYCEKISPGCANCYASNLQKRFQMPAFPSSKGNGNAVPYFDDRKLQEVLRRKKPTRWFWCDMTDMFGSWVTDEWIDKCFHTMESTPQHTHQVLTKRPERMREYLSWRWGKREDGPGYRIPAKNVWLGVSVEDQKRADERIPHLLNTPAAVRFLSCEPLLEQIDLRLGIKTCTTGTAHCCNCPAGPFTSHDSWIHHLEVCPGIKDINWVIVGGESGHGARPCDIAWIESLVKQCNSAYVPIFVKQLGAHVVEEICECGDWKSDHQGGGPCGICCQSKSPYDGCERFVSTGTTNRHVGTQDKKGGDISEFPEALRVREFPTIALS
jgi:protein gp37